MNQNIQVLPPSRMELANETIKKQTEAYLLLKPLFNVNKWEYKFCGITAVFEVVIYKDQCLVYNTMF